MDIVYYLVLLFATLLISFFMAVREIKYNQNIPLSLSLWTTRVRNSRWTQLNQLPFYSNSWFTSQQTRDVFFHFPRHESRQIFTLDSETLGYYRGFRSKKRLNTSAAYASMHMFLETKPEFLESTNIPPTARDTLPFSPPPRSKLSSFSVTVYG